MDRDVLEQAIALKFRDFEDAVQYICGLVHNVEAIVTRDTSGFIAREIPILLPEALNALFD